MYATYNIHVTTYNLEFLQVFDSRQEAIDHLKKDAESHVAKFRGLGRWITTKKDMSGLPDGYYLRLSKKHANRIVSYEKRTIVKRGYIYNTEIKEIVKSYVYGVTELPHETITSRFNLNAAKLKPVLQVLDNGDDRRNIVTVEVPQIGNLDEHINELKACLRTRRIKLGHRNPYLLDV